MNYGICHSLLNIHFVLHLETLLSASSKFINMSLGKEKMCFCCIEENVLAIVFNSCFSTEFDTNTEIMSFCSAYVLAGV